MKHKMVTSTEDNPKKIKRDYYVDPKVDLGVIWNHDRTKILIDHRPGKDKKEDE